jgi:hypothetical protein
MKNPRKMLNRRAKQVSDFIKKFDSIDLNFPVEDFDILVDEVEKECDNIKKSIKGDK